MPLHTINVFLQLKVYGLAKYKYNETCMIFLVNLSYV